MLPESPIKIEAGGQLKNVNELIHANNNDKSKMNLKVLVILIKFYFLSVFKKIQFFV